MRERIGALIAAYDAQGEHRTGSAVDAGSALWLARELAARGLDAELEHFSLERFLPGRAELELAGESLPGIAAFDGGTTDEEPIAGRLGPLGSDAELGVARVAPAVRGAALEAFERSRREGRHRALVALPERGALQPELALMNAESFAKPGGVPVLQLAGAHTERVEAAVAARTPARLFAAGTRETARAANVVARIAGREPSAAPLVVMTPRSGWFQCAAERGGGIAAWLEIAASLRSAVPRRPVWLVATSGHELGHLGLRAFLEAHADLEAKAQAWLHLGASFAARAEGGPALVLLQASDPANATLAREAFRRAGRLPDRFAPPGSPPLGEAREIAARSYLSLLGESPRFHTATDRWPDAVDLDKAVALTAGAGLHRPQALGLNTFY